MAEPPLIFISYSHKDERWKDKLAVQLDVLAKENRLIAWDDRRIAAGGDWFAEIQQAINGARVAVLLISAHFLTSAFILREEVPRLLAKRQSKGLQIVPVLVHPCPWKKVQWLTKIQMRPVDGREIAAGSDYQVDKDLATIAEEIDQLMNAGVPSPAERSNLTRPPRRSKQPMPHRLARPSQATIGKPLIFVSYSRRDERWKERLLKYLEGYQLHEMLETWADHHIEDGDEWFPEVFDAIARAELAVCLISPDYLSSRFCMYHELPYILRRHKNENLHLFLVHAEFCDYKTYEWFSGRQVFPRDGRPIGDRSTKIQNRMLADVATRIMQALGDRVARPREPKISELVQAFIEQRRRGGFLYDGDLNR